MLARSPPWLCLAHPFADVPARGQGQVRPRLCRNDAVLLQLPIAEAHVQLGAVCRQRQRRYHGVAGLHTSRAGRQHGQWQQEPNCWKAALSLHCCTQHQLGSVHGCLTLCSCTGHSLKAVRCPAGLPAPFMIAALQPAHSHTQAMWHHATLQFADLLAAVRQITAMRHFPAAHFRSNAETFTLRRNAVSLSAGRPSGWSLEVRA